VPTTIPGNNHQLARRLRPYAIEILVTRRIIASFENSDRTSTAANIDDNPDSAFWRGRGFVAWIYPSYNRIAVAAVCLNSNLVSMRMYIWFWECPLTFFSHSFTSLSSVELAALIFVTSPMIQAIQESVILCLINDDNMLCQVVVNLEVGIADTSPAARLECMVDERKIASPRILLRKRLTDLLSNIDFLLSVRADEG
jgi:hypothetical protein